MENTSKETSVKILIAVVVVVAVIVMILQEVSSVNKDNNTSRKGTVSATK